MINSKQYTKAHVLTRSVLLSVLPCTLICLVRWIYQCTYSTVSYRIVHV